MTMNVVTPAFTSVAKFVPRSSNRKKSANAFPLGAGRGEVPSTSTRFPSSSLRDTPERDGSDRITHRGRRFPPAATVGPESLGIPVRTFLASPLRPAPISLLDFAGV